MSAFRLLAALPLALCILAVPLHAAPTQAQQQAIRSACPSDFQTYCKGVQPGGADALQCLEKNVAKLSSACQQAVQAVSGGGSVSSGSSTGSASTTTAPAATTAPATTAAPAAPTSSGGETVVVVLKPRQEIMLMREACGNDYKKFCSGTEIGGGRAVQCIVSHASSLSGMCKSALSGLGQKF